MIGFKRTEKKSCFDCEMCHSEKYQVQGDSGRDVTCKHPNAPKGNYIGDTTWNTPMWCPAGEAGNE